MKPRSQEVVEHARDMLYALLPAEIRRADSVNGWPLRSYFGVLATGSIEIEEEIDALYDSMFVETAAIEKLPDLAALIGAELLRPLPADSGYNERAFIAKTIHYRRGKGTARILEELAADVGGFGSVAVEYFMRLARTQNLIDVRPERPATALLVPGVTRSNVGGAFDNLPRLADLRSIARAAGRHHVPNVGVHILRTLVPIYPAPPATAIEPAKFAGVPVARPWPDGATARPGYFQLAAQPGRVVRLFNPDRRSQDERSRVALTDLRDRLRRLPLYLETRELREAKAEGRPAILADPPWFDAVGNPFTIWVRRKDSTTFDRVPPEEILVANLDEAPPGGARPEPTVHHSWFKGGPTGASAQSADLPIRCAFDPVTGRCVIAQPQTGVADVEEVRVAHGTGIGRPIGAGPQERNGADLPFEILDGDQLIHFVRVVDSAAAETGSPADNLRTVQSLLTALDEWEAHGAGKRGIIVLTRCDLEGAASGQTNIGVAIHQDCELHIVAAKWVVKGTSPGQPVNPLRRGFVVRIERKFTIDSQLRISASSSPPGPQTGVLVLDGLEVTGGVSLAARSVARLLIRHCTVRAPGGVAVATTAALNGVSVQIDRSITGRLALDFGTQPSTGSVTITDSLVSADEAAGPALSATALDADLKNVTIFGECSFKSLTATNVIFAGAASAVRRQSGCVRFSYVAEGSTMPRRFRCQPDLALAAAEQAGGPLSAQQADAVRLAVTPLFLDTSLDEPTAAMLHPLCSDAIRLGGEDDTEMGVFSVAAEGLRRANLTSLFNDYVPVGLEAGVIDDTRSSAVASRRDLP